MSFSPLICKGNLSINGTPVPVQVTEFRFSGTRDQITIPATLGTEESYAAGDARYMVDIGWLADTDVEALSMIFFEAMDDDTGTVAITGTLRPGAQGPENPLVSGTAVVTSFGDLGGRVNTVAQASARFPLTARPVIDRTAA